MKQTDVIRLAFNKGYRVLEDGTVCSSVNNILNIKPHLQKNNYLTKRFTIRINEGRKTRSVPVHKLASFQKFGEAALVEGIQTRHLDGNSINNSLDNIEIGTASQNQMDKPKETRQRIAANAARKHTDETIAELRADRLAGMKYKDLQIKYGLPKSTLSFYLSPTGKLTSFANPVRPISK